MENNMVNVYFFGKKYSVPADLTIMTAMEYAGYTLKRGCGCRHGFCGACATIYRIKGENELKTCMSIQSSKQVTNTSLWLQSFINQLLRLPKLQITK